MKEKIKERMLKTIADSWNYNDSSLDPVVELLLEVCSTEISRITDAEMLSNTKILEKIASLLLPQAMNGPIPAYCTLHAAPNDMPFLIPAGYPFQYNGPGSDNPTASMWSSISSHRLFPFRLKYMQIDSTQYQLQEYWQKIVQFTATDIIPSSYNTIHLGIEINNFHSSISGLSVYFELRNPSEAEIFYQHLPYCKILIGNNLIAFKAGLETPPQANNANMFASDTYEAKIFSIQEKHYLTITDQRTITELTAGTNIPSENTEQPLLLLKIEFVPIISQQILEDLFCNLNCFPVINKKQECTIIRKIPLINLIPIESQDLLYAIDSIQDDSGYHYQLATGTDPKIIKEKEVILRDSGIYRFDERGIYNILNWIVDIIRSEYLPFELIKNETILTKLESLKQITLQLEELLPQCSSKDQTYYLVTKPGNSSTYFKVCFSSTCGNKANNIKAGSKLQEYKNSNLSASDIVFIHHSRNGSNIPNDRQKIDALRFQLLTQQRIVTIKDIEALCKYKLGEALSWVTVSKGITILPGNNGYSPSINIDIQLKPEHYLTEENIHFVKDEILFHLKTQSNNLFPYIIHIR